MYEQEESLQIGGNIQRKKRWVLLIISHQL